uniref:Ubiquitin carboxyl-terminal hydrolase n=1 Tax=Leptobrachium leishanense TaxID=445787 RepID=A0A8C5PRA1_9ANUR
MMPLLCLRGSIRIHCLDMGTSKWKEGICEVVERDNKFSLIVKYNVGGAPAKFQLNHNIKTIVLRPVGSKQSRLMLTLKDSSSLTIDKASSKDAEELKQFLDSLDKPQAVKPNQGSGSFGGILGNRCAQRDSNNKSQTPSKRVSFAAKDETPIKMSNSIGRGSAKLSFGTSAPGRPGNTPVTSTPQKSSLSENSTNKEFTDPARKFLSSSREKQLNLKQAEESRQGLMLLQSSSFYSSRSATKDYTCGNICTDRSSGNSQPHSAKRSLILPSQNSPLATKKLKPNQDYAGWNKQRVLSTHPQPQQLQGFSNLGNTCYMNAILQSLFSIQPFANDLLRQGIPYVKIPMNALIRRFALLLAKKDACSPEMKKELLKRVKNAISATAERFSGYMQNDAHEFLSQCLDQLKEDVGRLNKTWKTEPSPGEVSSVMQNDDIAATRVYTCPVISSFEFEVQHSIICKMCGETVTKREQFNDLSIDLPRRKKQLSCRSIQDSLDLFFRMEDLEYSCEKCNGKSATVAHKFSRLPRVLILHLKRYSFNVVLSRNDKVGQQVIIPRYLTLSTHCTESTRPPLSLGWTVQTAMSSRPLKTSQMVNSCSLNTSTPDRKYTFKPTNSVPICLDSESEDEVVRRCVSHSSRVFDLQTKEPLADDQDKKSSMESTKCSELDDAGFDIIKDEDLIEAVLETNNKEASADEEKMITSSPDTGFGGDDDVHESENLEPMEEKAMAGKDSGMTQFSEISKDFDENKENKTPESSQNDTDWLQYDTEREREEQELQQAIAQSLQEHEARELKEEDDLKKATELSLQEFNSSFVDGMLSDEDSGNEDILDMEYTEAEVEELKKNAETGELPHSYRLISVVSHIGSSSSSGHYISDVYDVKKQAWFTYNDLTVSRTQESTVMSERDQSGYIFFYINKTVFDDLAEDEKKSQPAPTDLNRPSRTPL